MKNFNSFFNQLTAMPKRLAMVLTVLFTLGVGSMCGAETTYTFTSSNWNAKIGSTSANWTNGKAGAGFANNGVQVTTNATGANATSPKSFENISQIIVTYNTNKNSGAGTLKIKVGDNTEKSNTCGYSGSSDGRTANFTSTFNFSPTQSGLVKLTVNTTTNSIYVVSVKIITEDVVKTPTSITLSEAGQTSNPSGTFYVGDLYQLPSTTTATCGDKTFVGWSTVTIDNSANKPTSDFYAPGVSVTLGANNTFYAVFAESGGTGSTSWEKTDISGISSSDVVVITMSKSGVTYAMMNNGGTSSPPGAEKITIDGNTIESTVYDTYKWNISNSSGNLTIYPNGTTTSWLYCTATNNGVRVGTNTNKTFTISGNYLKHTYTSRFVGVYLNNPDWRCYTGTTGTNIDSQTLAFYKKTTTSGYQNYTTECSTPTEFTVSFDANDHGTAPDEQIVASGQKATEPTPAPTATGYTFGGWYKDQICSNDKKFDFDTPITEDITLYAKWTAIQTTITLNANGGSGNTTSVAATYDSSTLNPSSITNPTKTGHTFGGWYSGEGGTGSLVINTSGKLQANVSGYTGANGVWKATTNETLYAKWTPSVYTITYKDQGNATFSGTHESGNPTQHTYGTETTLKGATKTGYTFGGWYKEAACTNKVTSLGATEYTANITLYAQWKANTYTVEFNANGGTGTMDNQSFTYDQSKALSANAFTRTNYAFKNWNTKFDGTGTNYTNQQSVSNLTAENGATVTLYAQWTPTYTITWLANEQEFHKQENAVEGTALDVPDSEPDASEYACDDKVFVGWTASQIDGSTDTEPADLFKSKTDKVEEAATTYYAVFATADAGGSTTDTYDWESDQTENWTVDAAITRTQSQGVDGSYAGKINTNNTYVTYNNKVAVTNFSFDFKRTSNNENYKVFIETSTDKSTWIEVATYAMSEFGNGSYTSKSQTFDGTQDLYVRFHCYNTTAVRYVDNVSITYGGTSYSEYVTTCAVIHDPVWGGAEIDNATISVNCGETSPMNSAATISFPAATNNTLTYDISVTASNGFLVSTNKTDNTKYGETVTVSPVKIGTNAGIITQKVYVRAVAPAQSDEDFNGTITISGKQITTQTINVTADVTCTGYTLTLVDRGVSTLQPETYFAGQTIDEAPADPEGVCTDPIHYVFDGWAEATVAEGSTTYTKVTFPYTVTGNTKFYAVYRYVSDGGEPSNDFIKVTKEKDDWTGDYVIVNEDAGKAIGNAYQNTNTLKAIDVTITDNKVVSPSNDII